LAFGHVFIGPFRLESKNTSLSYGRPIAANSVRKLDEKFTAPGMKFVRRTAACTR